MYVHPLAMLMNLSFAMPVIQKYSRKHDTFFRWEKLRQSSFLTLTMIPVVRGKQMTLLRRDSVQIRCTKLHYPLAEW